MQLFRTMDIAKRRYQLLVFWIVAMLGAGMVYAAPGSGTTGETNVTRGVEAGGSGKPATTLVNEPVSAQGIVQLVLGLGLVVGVILLLAWLARRVGGLRGYSVGSMRVLGGLSMGAREKVVLMQVGNTQILLGVAPGRVQTLHVLDEPVAGTERSAAQDEAGEPFAARLKTILKRTSE